MDHEVGGRLALNNLSAGLRSGRTTGNGANGATRMSLSHLLFPAEIVFFKKWECDYTNHRPPTLSFRQNNRTCPPPTCSFRQK